MNLKVTAFIESKRSKIFSVTDVIANSNKLKLNIFLVALVNRRLYSLIFLLAFETSQTVWELD